MIRIHPSGIQSGFYVFATILFLLSGCSPVPERNDAEQFRSTGADPGESNLLIITLDTLRADHLSCYGYPRPTSPCIDSIARRGLTVVRAVCAVPFTNPSHASLFTGRYPWEHGCRDNYATLPGTEITLAAMLKSKGYRTAAFVSGSPLKSEISGMHTGFDVYDDDMTDAVYHQTKILLAEDLPIPGESAVKPAGGHVLAPYSRRAGEDTMIQVLKWLETAREPWFLWVHLYDVHGPYIPPHPKALLFRDIWDPDHLTLDGVWIADYQRNPSHSRSEYIRCYDGCIYHADGLVEILIHRLQDRSLSDSTCIVVLSDHGESLGEHRYGFDHGRYLYEASLQIPLLYCFPGILHPDRITNRFVSEIDVLPDVWQLLWNTPPEIPRGRSLSGRNVLFGQPVLKNSRRLCETKPVHPKETDRRLFGVTDTRWKYIYTLDPENSELYNLATDPEEEQNIIREAGTRQTASELRNLVREAIIDTDRTSAQPALLQPEQQQMLKSLGYFD